MVITQLITQPATFLYKRGPIYYFRRHVPIDLQQHYPTRIICTSLRTRSLSIAQRSASVIANKLDAEWMTLRLNNVAVCSPTSTALTQPTTTFAEALDLYLRLKSTGKSATFENGARRCVDYLSEAVKEKPLAEYTTIDAGQFRDHLLNRGLSSSSVRRVFTSIKAIYNLASSEYGIQQPNPFTSIYLPDLKDVKKRMPFSESDLRSMQAICKDINDDLRWLFALVSDTGMRLSEATGLYWSDVYLDAPIPYVDLKPNAHRRLKTDASTRQIPLVGASLWAVEQAYAEKSGEYVFPRYMKNNKCNANSASAALGKWIKSQVSDDVSIHSLRHACRDRLRAIQCPTEIIDQIGGWSSNTVGSKYGNGYNVEVLHYWMTQITS